MEKLIIPVEHLQAGSGSNVELVYSYQVPTLFCLPVEPLEYYCCLLQNAIREKNFLKLASHILECVVINFAPISLLSLHLRKANAFNENCQLHSSQKFRYYAEVKVLKVLPCRITSLINEG
jgi:hypothetical protein